MEEKKKKRSPVDSPMWPSSTSLIDQRGRVVDFIRRFLSHGKSEKAMETARFIRATPQLSDRSPLAFFSAFSSRFIRGK